MAKEVNIDKEKVKKKGKKTFGEFKAFIAKGNIMDMAVGVIMGSAFGKIVSSLVDDILMPLIGVLIGGIDFTRLSVKVEDATITYGNFIQNIIDFLIIAICIFVMIKFLEKLNKKIEEEIKNEEAKLEAEKAEEPKKDENTVLLEEIRDLLKEKENV